MPICLEVSRQAAAGAEARVYRCRLDASDVLIGRSENVDVRLPDLQVSLVHGRLLSSGAGSAAQLIYVDLDSTNGSIVDGRPAIARERISVGVGSRIVVGPFLLAVVSEEEAARSSSTQDTASLARQMVRDALRLMERESLPFLEVISGPLTGTTHTLSLGSTAVLGRGDACDLRLEDADASRLHAEVVHGDEGIRVVDLGSKNGVLLNDVRFFESAPLEHGDVLQIGSTHIRLVDPAEATLHELGRGDDEEPVIAQPRRPAPGLEAVRSGELHGGGQRPQGLSPASAFELVTPSSVLQRPQLAADAPVPEAKPSRHGDLLVLVLGVLLVGGGAALIVYLVSY